MAYQNNLKINSLDTKSNPTGTDGFVLGDSADSSRAKVVTYTELLTDLQNSLQGYFDTTTDTLDDITVGTTNKHFTATEESKLSGIATAATANDTDSNLKNRANHTGTQTASTISDFDTEVSNNTEVAANTAKVSYTDAAKVAGIEAGAEVNNISDTDATDLTDGGITTLHSHDVEGTAVKSTGETGGTKFLREDGDGTSSWQAIAGGGDVSKVGTPVNNQVGVWTGDGTIEGDVALTFDTTTDTLATGIVTTTGAVTATGAVTGSNLSGTNTGDQDLSSYAPIANPTFTGEIGIGSVNVSETELGILEGATLTTAELNYVDGVTSAIQTQLDAKLADVVEDTTPTLGGDLDANSNDITNIGKVDYTIANGGVSALGNLGSTETIDWSTATHFTGTLDANVTITHSNELAGEKITLALTYSGAQRTITWSDVDTWLDNSDGSAPDAPAASGDVLLVTLIRLGTTVYATAAGNYAVYA